MLNFANWHPLIRILIGIVALALAVAGLREFPELTKLASGQQETASKEAEPELTDVRIVTETEEGKPVKGASVRFSYRGSPTERITTDDGYVQIKIPSTEDVEITLSKEGYETRKHIINLKNDPGENRTFLLKRKQIKSNSSS
ncbi:MAG: carboxypeptidase-like regulatory domain-containing protein [Symplocastrum torsivum CPER-KK1]|jgi:IMP dehydrogenase/GMP reductase|uniref:Carboxypeptidase-like regulatory domain-containing protein n=1 Tax=Symplocastrum torsivum CPER-KK1 TaxID=450513 RepID=A0A951PP31_9CYAN|nr:carboxypeptidase-like regulatory domain-containing protein [Symplocastrum torsivum CPER-KK1]